ncbi:MAG: hypothetical protein KDB02_06490 [Acidimicrobiales bacterium]|nr:hypothetical protein [Acidimicrobiales bacterium]
MRVLTTIKSSPSFGPPPEALMEAIGEFGAEGFRDGYLLDTGGLMPGRFVQLRSGEVEVTDGPFTETKEIVGGYAMRVRSTRPTPIGRGSSPGTTCCRLRHRRLWWR